MNDRCTDGRMVSGGPENCVERLREYEGPAVDQVDIRRQFPGQPQAPTLSCLRRFDDGVFPEV